MITLDLKNIGGFLPNDYRNALQSRLEDAQKALLTKTGAGNDFLGWLDLVQSPNQDLIADVQETANEIRQKADVLVCIGIGGSYLGAKAVIDALTPYYNRQGTEILFAGHQMSGAYLRDLLAYLEGKSVYVNIISKSGTTLEPALSTRHLVNWMKANFEDADQRIVATTDANRGALKKLADANQWKQYVIPDDVGGRFSVLTPVGLLPIAVAGIDVADFYAGASAMSAQLQSVQDNLAFDYVALRYALLEAGYKTEVLSVFEQKLYGIGGWWQQLYGESEGKEGKGLFPAVMQFSTDLHSLGQYMQDGQRVILETFLMAQDDNGGLGVPKIEGNLDGLDYLSDKTFTEINRKAYEGTSKAHTDGGVPNLTIWMDSINPKTLGELLYFFEHGVALSGYLLGVNPFDQPGVEDYKREMFSLLGK